MMYGFGNGWGMGMGYGWIIGLLIVGAIVWLIIRSINQNNVSHQHNKSALDILKERYAKGEIGKEEYEAKKKDLS
jgi:putative membrane protein